jgi:prepilin-type N-terminal cleavage/methylation domain-containing protein/prepilin-type processing-associated H-X9-DG protein
MVFLAEFWSNTTIIEGSEELFFNIKSSFYCLPVRRSALNTLRSTIGFNEPSASREGAELHYITMNNRKKKAFTLIELLVVIAIIAILAAILFPVFAQAKAAAKGAACLSNTKQIALGGLMYSEDVDDQILPSYTLVASSWESTAAGQTQPLSFWSDLVQPYIKSGAVTPANFGQTSGIGVLHDQGASVSALNASSVYPGYDYAGRPGFTVLADYTYAITGFGGLHDYLTWLYDASYGHTGTCPGEGDSGGPAGIYGASGSSTNPCMNPPGNGPGVPGTLQSATGPNWSGTFATNNATTSVARPSETIIASDGVTIVQQAAAGTVPTFTLYAFPGGGDAVHNGGGNYAFVDGHAKRISKNPLDYVTLSSGGYYIMTYLTMSE